MASTNANTNTNKGDFSSSTGIGGGDPGRDYNPTSADRDNQPTGDTGNFGGGIGDRTQGAGKFGGEGVQNLSAGDQYGSSGGYLPRNGDTVFGAWPADKAEENK